MFFKFLIFCIPTHKSLNNENIRKKCNKNTIKIVIFKFYIRSIYCRTKMNKTDSAGCKFTIMYVCKTEIAQYTSYYKV